MLTSEPSPTMADALETLCARADEGETVAREAIVTFSALMQAPDTDRLLGPVRDEMQLRDLPRVARLFSAWPAPEAAPDSAEEDERHVPDYGAGRPLTLGERKALARRPTRRFLSKLLADPHPQVIRNLLANPLTTEDDVVRLAAKRPIDPAILAEIAAHGRWQMRRRVQLAIVLNPSSPPSVAVPLVSVLLRADLRQVVASTEAGAEVRMVAAERLNAMVRRPE